MQELIVSQFLRHNAILSGVDHGMYVIFMFKFFCIKSMKYRITLDSTFSVSKDTNLETESKNIRRQSQKVVTSRSPQFIKAHRS